MKVFMKVTVSALVGATLFVAGYSAGLLVQHYRDDRLNAALAEAHVLRLHKSLAVGNYDRASQETNAMLMSNAITFEKAIDFDELPYLFRESLLGRDDTGYHRAAVGQLINLHRARPDIVFPREVQPEMAAFVPHADYEFKALKWYSWWNPAGA